MATEARNRIPSDPAAPGEPRTRPERRPATFTVELTRAEDQTRVTYEFVDLVLRGDTLVATGPTAQPLVRMRPTPQHTAEVHNQHAGVARESDRPDDSWDSLR